jgi:membrane fusion protein, multidrug efflux system
MERTRNIWFGMAAVALALTGAGLSARHQGGEHAASTAGHATGAAIEGLVTTLDTDVAIPVEGHPVVQDTLVLAVAAAGEAAARRRATLLAQVEGRVHRVVPREADAVAGGALIIEIDPEEYRLGVEEAGARLRQAEAQYRELTLLDDRIDDAAVRMERERAARARSGLDVAAAVLRRAELALERARALAPFPGHVADLRVVPGQWVQRGEELVTIVELDPMRVEVRVLEGEVGFVRAGGSARVAFAALPGEFFDGRIETVNPVVERDSRAARVTVRVANPGGRILPGMYARVSLEARSFPDRLLVPRSAILERDRRPMLFVYDGDERGGLAKWRYVTVGLGNEQQVEIVPSDETDTVWPGEVVLTGGHYTLIHDARVRLVDAVRGVAAGRPD